ncbi:MAG: hypothetical protein ACYDBJ_18545 [Aggregatilineales bacterium]
MLPQVKMQWRVPSYAQDRFVIRTDVDFVNLHWLDTSGPVLTYWNLPSRGESVNWGGVVNVGGFIERLHARRIAEVDFIIAEVVGGAFPADYTNLPTLADMNAGVFSHPPDIGPADVAQTYPFILEADSHFAALAQDALVSRLAVDVSGHFAPDEDRWHEVCGLPLIADALTLLSAG